MTLSLDPAELGPREAYRLFVSVVVPRPIAWVSTVSLAGVTNLAPYSFFNGVAGPPPVVMWAAGQRHGAPKDSLSNAIETGEFVVNLADRSLAEALNLSSGDWAPDVSEFELAGLEAVPSEVVRPPRVALAPVALEARVTQVVPVTGTTSTMVLGEVVRFHIRPDLLGPDGLVLASRFAPIARLGRDEYSELGEVFSMARPGR